MPHVYSISMPDNDSPDTQSSSGKETLHTNRTVSALWVRCGGCVHSVCDGIVRRIELGLELQASERVRDDLRVEVRVTRV